MLKNRLNLNHNLWTIIGYLVSTILVLTITAIFFPDLFNENNFIHWDAGHYYFIRNQGYEGLRVAFFPLFPFIWKFLSVGAYGAVLLNGFIFCTSFYFLAKMLKLGVLESLLYLTIPSSIFHFLPFTEAMFFASSVLILIGYRKEKTALVVIGLLLSSLARPAFIFFIAAVVITELYNAKLSSKKIIRIALLLMTMLAGLGIVFTIHYYYTGNWFAYFEMTKQWGNGVLQLPRLPFTSWSEGMILRLDAAAMLVGILAGLLLLAILFKTKLFKSVPVSKDVVFALTYVGGVTLFLIFRGGSIFSLNRFIFATPFIIVAFNFWMKLPLQLRWKHLYYIFGTITLFWLLFGSYGHLQTMLKFSMVSFYMMLIFLPKVDRPHIKRISLVLFIMLNLTFQIIFYLKFLHGHWIG